MAVNQAAWLHEAGTPLKVGDAPMPIPGPNDIIVRNAAVAINPLDGHMQKAGVFVQNWPAIFGCDVAGTVYAVGEQAKARFKEGDRVIGHAINLVTGLSEDGAFASYTRISADKAASLPGHIPFTDGVVVPFALEAAVCALSVKEPGVALPGVATPALGLPYPSMEKAQLNKTLIVYGGSSSIGSMTTQLASAAGIRVIAIASEHNFEFCRECGAGEVFDYHDPAFVDSVISAVDGQELIGIFDAIATPETYGHDLTILSKLGGGHLACVHPPPPDVPANVQAGMIFGVNDVATPVWKDYVTAALETGKLKCLPRPRIVGKGLENVQMGLEVCEAGVSAEKLVIEL